MLLIRLLLLDVLLDREVGVLNRAPETYLKLPVKLVSVKRSQSKNTILFLILSINAEICMKILGKYRF